MERNKQLIVPPERPGPTAPEPFQEKKLGRSLLARMNRRLGNFRGLHVVLQQLLALDFVSVLASITPQAILYNHSEYPSLAGELFFPTLITLAGCGMVVRVFA